MNARLSPRLRVGLAIAPCPKKDLACISIAILAAIVLCTHLDDRDLWPSHEARAAQNALGFFETGHFGLLRLLDGTPEYQKPPLYYWMVAAIAWLRSGLVDGWSVRLPAAVGGWLSIVAVMIWLRRRERPIAACLAGLALLCSHHFVSTTRTGRIDSALMATTLLAALALIEGRAVAAGVMLASSLLLKGPIGLAIFLSVVGSWWLLRRDDSWKRLIPAGVLGLLLAAPWFAFVTWETGGEFAHAFFWRHNVQRATGGTAELATHPLWFYPARWVVDCLPVSLVGVPLVAWGLWRGRKDAELTIGAIAAVAITGLLTLSQFKRADYLMPAYPWAAIAVGCAAEHVSRRWLRPGVCAISAATLGAGLIYELWLLPRADARNERRSLAAEVRAIAGRDAPVIFFRVEDHPLALHVGKPLMSVREWENLDVWMSRLSPGYIVMPLACASEWPSELSRGTLREVYRHADQTQRARPRSWVLMRSEPIKRND